ncbi:BON domain-containing protein [Methylobacillus flagellatus]|uniref:BON domain-containing protein n=1 Tax=Methylobacillus flagellatus TaxID=405 RepID=UPI0010F5DAC7|nr:BON domain-containing protein [Methylobacillus flagellatus]
MSTTSSTMLKVLVLATLATQLNACVPVMVGGAATAGSVAIDRRSAGNVVDDEGIELKANHQISQDVGDAVHANVTSFNRNVLITGEAFDEKSRAAPEAIVKSYPNVRHVTNELVIAPKTSLQTRSADAYITTKVKGSFVKENLFNANHVKVVTENGTVFLMGVVTQKEADDAVEIARNISGVNKVVKVFEYVEAAPK